MLWPLTITNCGSLWKQWDLMNWLWSENGQPGITFYSNTALRRTGGKCGYREEGVSSDITTHCWMLDMDTKSNHAPLIASYSRCSKKSYFFIDTFCVFLWWHPIADVTKNLLYWYLLCLPLMVRYSRCHKKSNNYVDIFSVFPWWNPIADVTKFLTITLIYSVFPLMAPYSSPHKK